MRVVSQDGKIDIPYENSCLNIVCIEPKRTAIYSYSTCCDASLRLAEYSTEAKAIKAMKMLKRAYENNMFYHCMANRKGFVEAQGALGAEQFRKATTEYFQFPQDDEIEV